MLKLVPISLVLLAASAFLPAQTFTVLYNFGDKPGDPIYPGSAVLAQSRGGNMFSSADVCLVGPRRHRVPDHS